MRTVYPLPEVSGLRTVYCVLSILYYSILAEKYRNKNTLTKVRMSGYTSSITSLRRIRSHGVSVFYCYTNIQYRICFFYVKTLPLMALGSCARHGLNSVIVRENLISFTESKDMKYIDRFTTFLSHRLIRSLVVSIVVVVLVATGFSILYKQPTNSATAITITASDLSYPWNDATLIDPSNYDWGYPAKACPANDPKCTNSIAGAHTVLNGIPYGVSDPWGYEFKNCTSYVAWRVETLGGHVGSLGNGGQWYIKSQASMQSLIPQQGDAAVEPISSKHRFGHVAFVESVNSVDASTPGNDIITVSEYNFKGYGLGDLRTGPAASMGFTQFVNFGISLKPIITPTASPAPGIYAKKIIQWNGDTKVQKTSWLVWPLASKLVRYSIPDSSTYYCLINEGYADAGPVSSDILNQLPDQTGQKATCVKPPVITLTNTTPTAKKFPNTPTVVVHKTQL